ncbi:hypothetical protein [Candidatus Binatus sp.]|uniref:hypothetical protein n=1 Tax=Candidatus Binatus sp. TaxID=2811406 RepID=UPI003BAEB549
MAIRTQRLAELVDYFDQRLPARKSKWLALVASSETEDLKLEIGPLKIPFPARAFRIVGRSILLSEAARRWLRPNFPCLSVADLGRLQREAALDDVDLAAFASEIKYECLQLSRDHPELMFWIRKRTALLDYILEPPKQPSSESLRGVIGLHQGLMQAVSYVYSMDNMEAVAGMADDLSATALNAAAQEVCSILGKGPCYVNANLMVPLKMTNGSEPVFSPAGTTAAVERSNKLWAGRTSAARCLMVVAETEDAGHLGFWVPLARTADGGDLPGAPTAYFRLSGDAVFKDDLPDLIGFADDLNRDWQDYIVKHLHEDLFVSLPFLVPGAPPPSSATTVAAVLNVNVRPSDAESWRRGYHKEWKDIATGRAAPFIEVAFHAFLVKMEAYRRAGGSFVPLDTGVKPWNTLPGSQVVRYIEEKKS